MCLDSAWHPGPLWLENSAHDFFWQSVYLEGGNSTESSVFLDAGVSQTQEMPSKLSPSGCNYNSCLLIPFLIIWTHACWPTFQNYREGQTRERGQVLSYHRRMTHLAEDDWMGLGNMGLPKFPLKLDMRSQGKLYQIFPSCLRYPCSASPVTKRTLPQSKGETIQPAVCIVMHIKS